MAAPAAAATVDFFMKSRRVERDSDGNWLMAGLSCFDSWEEMSGNRVGTSGGTACPRLGKPLETIFVAEIGVVKHFGSQHRMRVSRG